MNTRVRDILRSGGVALGVGLMYPSPSAVEGLGKGWDWMWIDGQHGQLSYDTILRAVQTSELTGLSPIVRVPGHAPEAIGQTLDTGAAGVMVPMVNTPDEARAIVHAAYFPPLGGRSYGGRRVIDLAGREFYQTANDEILLIAQIETLEAAASAGDIASVEGIDALFFGPDDMKMRMGIPINTPVNENDDLRNAMKTMADAARAAGKYAGCVAATPESCEMAVSQGYQLIAGGADIAFLRAAAEARREALRAVLEKTRPPSREKASDSAY